MAHEYAKELLKTTHANHGFLSTVELENVSEVSWALAELMQAESDKRKPKGLPEVLFEPDWSVAPDWANYWTIDLDCNSYWYRNKPSMVEYGWESNGGIIGNAPNFKYFSYSDKFRDSLRKRP